jgi:hypothetical protein
MKLQKRYMTDVRMGFPVIREYANGDLRKYLGLRGRRKLEDVNSTGKHSAYYC